MRADVRLTRSQCLAETPEFPSSGQPGPTRTFSGEYMKASFYYRIAAVLLLLFAAGHTLGFRQSDPAWGMDTLLASMRSIHFDVQGFSRTYWDLFVAAGFSVGLFFNGDYSMFHCGGVALSEDTLTCNESAGGNSSGESQPFAIIARPMKCICAFT
jgi:hypothetical protein